MADRRYTWMHMMEKDREIGKWGWSWCREKQLEGIVVCSEAGDAFLKANIVFCNQNETRRIIFKAVVGHRTWERSSRKDVKHVDIAALLKFVKMMQHQGSVGRLSLIHCLSFREMEVICSLCCWRHRFLIRSSLYKFASKWLQIKI